MVGLDYFYITAGGVKCRRELAQEEIADGEAALQEERLGGSLVKCLIMRCFNGKAIFAHCIPYKARARINTWPVLLSRTLNGLGTLASS